MRRSLAHALLLSAVVFTVPRAQMRVVPIDEMGGHIALGLTLRHLGNTGVLLHTTAHPDDENNGLLVMLNRGLGYRTVLATATRGNGGQNEIGPELFEALGVLRTKELEALHRFDGAEQYFTRAVDFGYSFSIEETFEKWGRDEITSDYVRLVRMVRPDVVIALMPTGGGGGQHHQASAVITHDAVKLAGDATKYPDQLKDGLRPWQPKKFYYLTGFGFPGEQLPSGPLARINLAVYDPLLGKTYAEIGTEARSMHKCQGMAQLLSLPGPSTTTYQLSETTMPGPRRDETSLFDGIDTSIIGLSKFVSGKAPKDLMDGLATISAAVATAQKNYDGISDQSTVKPLLDGLFAVRVLRRTLRGMAIDDAARFDIDFRLRQKEREFQQASLLANGVLVEALADDGVVVPGQEVKVQLIVANRGAVDVNVKSIAFEGFAPTGSAQAAGASCALTQMTRPDLSMFGMRDTVPPGPPVSVVKKDQVARCEPALKIPANARISEPYWHRAGEAGRYTVDADAPFGLPFRPTTFYASATLTFAGAEEVFDTVPVQHRYEGNVFSGEKRTDLLVVPPLSVRVTPEVAIVPAASIRSTPTQTARGSTSSPRATGSPGSPRAAGSTGSPRGAGSTGSPESAGGRGRGSAPRSARPEPVEGRAPGATREIRVTVVNDLPGAADATVRLDTPQGWTVTPPQQALAFTRADESLTVKFDVTPASGTAVGEFHVKAMAALGQAQGDAMFDRGYQTIEYPHITRAHIYDPADTTMKVIDVRTPANLTIGYVMGVGDQVPPAIAQLGARVDLLSADDLAWGDLSRFDAIVTGVRAYERREDLRANNRRLLEYVFNGGTALVQYNKFEFNDAQYGPYPAKVSANRVTDENAPVEVLDPHNPVFTTPNEIGPDAWKGWVQERGLYFLGEKDSRYRDLVQLEDPFPNNPGKKLGALAEAQYGKGRWIYIGLGLWRQLPAGTDGAYQLLANLISIGKTTR